MNRRDFIKAMIVLGASINLPIDVSMATESQLDEICGNEAFFFDVCGYSNAIWVSNFEQPQTREEAYGVSAADMDSDSELIDFAQRTPLASDLQNAYMDYRIELEDLAEEGDKKARRLIKELPDDEDEGWIAWLNAYPEKARESIDPIIEKFFESEPSWSESENFPDDANAQGAAFQFFQRYEDQSVLDQLGIEIVEGDVPGSSYYAAELTIPVEQANLIAKKLMLPYRFRQV